MVGSANKQLKPGLGMRAPASSKPFVQKQKSLAIPSSNVPRNGGGNWPSQNQAGKGALEGLLGQGKKGIKAISEKKNEGSQKLLVGVLEQGKKGIQGLTATKTMEEGTGELLKNELGKGKEAVNKLFGTSPKAVEGGKELLKHELGKGKERVNELFGTSMKETEGTREFVGKILGKGENGESKLFGTSAKEVEGTKEFLGNALGGKDGQKEEQNDGSQFDIMKKIRSPYLFGTQVRKPLDPYYFNDKTNRWHDKETKLFAKTKDAESPMNRFKRAIDKVIPGDNKIIYNMPPSKTPIDNTTNNKTQNSNTTNNKTTNNTSNNKTSHTNNSVNNQNQNQPIVKTGDTKTDYSAARATGMTAAEAFFFAKGKNALNASASQSYIDKETKMLMNRYQEFTDNGHRQILQDVENGKKNSKGNDPTNANIGSWTHSKVGTDMKTYWEQNRDMYPYIKDVEIEKAYKNGERVPHGKESKDGKIVDIAIYNKVNDNAHVGDLKTFKDKFTKSEKDATTLHMTGVDKNGNQVVQTPVAADKLTFEQIKPNVDPSEYKRPTTEPQQSKNGIDVSTNFRKGNEFTVNKDPNVYLYRKNLFNVDEATDPALAASAATSGKYGSASAGITFGQGQAKGSADFALKKDGVSLESDFEAGYYLMKGQANAQTNIGGVGFHAGASGDIGPSVKGSADLKAGMVDGKFQAGADAEIGAYLAKGEISGGVNLFGLDITARAQGKVGAGAEAGIGFKDGKFYANLGATLGIGGSVGIEIDASELIDNIGSGIKNIGSAIGDGFDAFTGWLGF